MTAEDTADIMTAEDMADIIGSLIELNSNLEADPGDEMIQGIKEIKSLPNLIGGISGLDIIFEDETKIRITVMGDK